MEKTSYKAESITILKDLQAVREKYDLNWLASQINNRGSIIKLSKKLNINRATLRRAIVESNMIFLFPKLSKSKVNSLSTLKTRRELILFTKSYDIYKLSVRKLYKLVKNYRKKLESNPNLLLTKSQHNLIIGDLLGDANIKQREKNCSFRVGHSRKQKKYLYWKYNILKEFIKNTLYWNIRNLNDRTIETLEFATFTHIVFNYYRKLFYKNGIKTVTREILNLLNPRSLAVWLCDDGSYCKKYRYIILSTNSFSLNEHEIMKKYFEEVWGLSPTIGFRDNKYYYLRFKVEDTKKLISIVRPFILKVMKYKIGE